MEIKVLFSKSLRSNQFMREFTIDMIGSNDGGKLFSFYIIVHCHCVLVRNINDRISTLHNNAQGNEEENCKSSSHREELLFHFFYNQKVWSFLRSSPI